MERERFLDAVAHRLGRPRLQAAPSRPTTTPPWSTSTASSLVEQFASETRRVGGTVSVVQSLTAVKEELAEAILESGQAPIVASALEEFQSWEIDSKCTPFDRVTFWGETAVRTPERYRQVALRADLGITKVDLAVAATGTLLIRATRSAPRSTSLLPRRHLALVRADQLVPHLGDALRLGGELVPRPEDMPSGLIGITGPSRTSDIENDLSIGVHGPEAVHVIIWEERAA